MSGLVIPHFGLARQYKNIGEELLDATHRALKDGQTIRDIIAGQLGHQELGHGVGHIGIGLIV